MRSPEESRWIWTQWQEGENQEKIIKVVGIFVILNPMPMLDHQPADSDTPAAIITWFNKLE